jgi:8-oxo-dGTP pyrophosphatase MutT (NUDIX family)
LTSLLQDAKRQLFWLVSRFCFTAYRAFPIFGPLRASIGIIREGERFLVIQRNDGRGLSLPGGIAGWRESETSTLRREVHEETGLNVTRMEFKMKYSSTSDVPCTISVFQAEADGELKDSWEGSPHWMAVSELEARLLQSQKPALELMKQMSAQSHPPGGRD